MAGETEVIVIGAGAAGLAAAKTLDQQGITSIVVEGSDHIGGRAHSREIAPGVWFDQGCAWLVEGVKNPFVPLAKSLGIKARQDKGSYFMAENHRLWRDGTPLDDEQRLACARYFADCEQAIAAAAAAGQDVALSDVLDLTHEYADAFKLDVSTGWGKDVEFISTVDHATAYGELGFPVDNGYGNLVAAWGRDVPVSRNTRVTQVDWSGNGVKVTSSQGSIRGQMVLITVSAGVLAAGGIRFLPGLPEWKREAIAQLPMGTENKIGVYFTKDVFGPAGRGHYSSWQRGDSQRNVKIEVGVMAQNTAVVFAGGRRGVGLEALGERACSAYALERLADIFGSGIRQHVGGTIVTAWASDPWTYGAWACARPGQAHQRAALARPVHERLFFAGEATINGLQGTCHGAYLSGIRAAQEIAACLAL